MVTVQINHDEEGPEGIADYLQDLATKVRDGFTSGPDWDLTSEDGDLESEDAPSGEN